MDGQTTSIVCLMHQKIEGGVTTTDSLRRYVTTKSLPLLVMSRLLDLIHQPITANYQYQSTLINFPSPPFYPLLCPSIYGISPIHLTFPVFILHSSPLKLYSFILSLLTSFTFPSLTYIYFSVHLTFPLCNWFRVALSSSTIHRSSSSSSWACALLSSSVGLPSSSILDSKLLLLPVFLRFRRKLQRRLTAAGMKSLGFFRRSSAK